MSRFTFAPLVVVIAFVLVSYSYYRFKKATFVHRVSFDISYELEHYRHYNTSPFREDEVLPAFINYYENYRIAPKYNLATCQIQKSLSTLRAGIFCLLYDQEGFMKQNNSISKQDWDNMFCGNSNEYFSINAVEHLLKPGFKNFVVVRDPVDRFLSGFVDKCVNEEDRGFCYDCHRSMRCFLEKQYERFQRYLSGKLLETQSGFEDIHFAPQTWYCAFSSRFSDYEFVRYGKGKEIQRMTEDVLRILKNSHVDSHLLDIIRKETLKGKTYHTTSGSSTRALFEKELLNDSYALSLLTRIYYFDFIVFGYDFPRY